MQISLDKSNRPVIDCLNCVLYSQQKAVYYDATTKDGKKYDFLWTLEFTCTPLTTGGEEFGGSDPGVEGSGGGGCGGGGGGGGGGDGGSINRFSLGRATTPSGGRTCITEPPV